MYKFAAKLKRKFTKSYRLKTRFSRHPSKLRLIQQHAEDELSAGVFHLEGPGLTATSANTASPDQKEADADLLQDQVHVSRAERRPSITDVISTDAEDSGAQAEWQDPTVDIATSPTTEEALSHMGQEQPSLDDAAADEDSVDEQVVREQRYITFTKEGDDEGDYTEGPPSMIVATDGVKPCAALLMTLPLSNKIKTVIRAQKAFSDTKRRALEEKGIYTRFGYDLESEINSHKRRLSGGKDMEEVQKRQLEEELSNLELMLDINRSELVRIQSDVQYQSRMLHEHYAELNAELEPALIRAQLLEPGTDEDDVSLEELDLQKEYQKFVQEQQNGSDAGTPVTATPLDTSRDHWIAEQEPLSEEDQREVDLKNGAWEAFWRLDSARQAFDNRQADRHADHLANTQAAERGEATTDASPEEFDLRWVQKIQELTRELIEAESALSTAKAAAAEGGVDVHMNDGTSGFGDDPDDGYHMSMEQAMVSSVPSPKIKDWMSGIPEVASPSFNEHAEEADEWEAEEVEMCDSVSMTALDPGDRKRIDKWQKMCKLEQTFT